MSDATRSQAIMFEPADDLEQPAGRSESADGQAAGRSESADGQAAVLREPADGQAAGGAAQTREQITFEQGYEQLKIIVSRLDDPELPIHEMFEGFRRGKGLEKALRAYLQEREGELTELEEGKNLAEFEIASPSSGDRPSSGRSTSPS